MVGGVRLVPAGHWPTRQGLLLGCPCSRLLPRPPSRPTGAYRRRPSASIGATWMSAEPLQGQQAVLQPPLFAVAVQRRVTWRHGRAGAMGEHPICLPLGTRSRGRKRDMPVAKSGTLRIACPVVPVCSTARLGHLSAKPTARDGVPELGHLRSSPTAPGDRSTLFPLRAQGTEGWPRSPSG